MNGFIKFNVKEMEAHQKELHEILKENEINYLKDA